MVPFGFVELDGKTGRAPFEVNLPPGTYTLRAGRSEKALTHRESIRVKVGERKDVLVELGAEE